MIICGHYEGVDERFTQKYVDMEISLGDFVLTGGEMPAMAIVDAVSRLIPGVVGNNSSVTEDSFYSGMLDTPHYTRPAEWRGERVPEVLTNGDAKAIDRWRRRRSVERTLDRRPDIAARAGIIPWLSGGAYVMEVHYPVLDKRGEKSSTAITGMDLHDIARACRTYGIKKYLLVTPLAQQREMAKRIAGHWTSGWGSEYNPDRKEAFSTLKIFASVQKALAWVLEKEKREPFKIATTAKRHAGARHWLSLKREILKKDHSPVFMFGTGWGLHDEVMDISDAVMTPITGGCDGWNHLSVRSAVGITLDRFFGWR